jgi:hypothetical protein
VKCLWPSRGTIIKAISLLAAHEAISACYISCFTNKKLTHIVRAYRLTTWGKTYSDILCACAVVHSLFCCTTVQRIAVDSIRWRHCNHRLTLVPPITFWQRSQATGGLITPRGFCHNLTTVQPILMRFSPDKPENSFGQSECQTGSEFSSSILIWPLNRKHPQIHKRLEVIVLLMVSLAW